MQWRKKTNSSGNNRPAQEVYREWIVWPESVCCAVFFSAGWGYLCIYGFLEETVGSVYALCMCLKHRESERKRERARDHVNKSVCNVLSSWTLCWTLRLSEEGNSRRRRFFFVLIVNPFVRSFNLVLFFLVFVDARPKGCNVAGALRILWTFF